MGATVRVASGSITSLGGDEGDNCPTTATITLSVNGQEKSFTQQTFNTDAGVVYNIAYVRGWNACRQAVINSGRTFTYYLKGSDDDYYKDSRTIYSVPSAKTV